MILLLDAYHLGDPLFATALARDLKARPGGLVVVHGSAEAGERALESAGAWPESVDGVWRVGSESDAAAVERATRELNRRLVAEVNEAGVSVIGLVGASRGLLRRDDAGMVAAGRTAWLATLVAQGGVPVVAALVDPPPAVSPSGALREVDAAAAAAALAAALGTAVVVLTSSRADGLPGADGALAEAVPLDAALASGRLPEGSLVTRLVASGVPVRAATAAALRSAGLPAGTWIGDARPVAPPPPAG